MKILISCSVTCTLNYDIPVSQDDSCLSQGQIGSLHTLPPYELLRLPDDEEHNEEWISERPQK